jgi:DNA-binding NarL/FixJ family response regulator
MVHIALIDDNVYLLKALKAKLALFSDLKVVQTANDGKEVAAQLDQYAQVDLMLMDIEMPGKNGIETTELVKSRYPQIKVIMLTVFDNDENIFRAIKAGADGYLLKEIDPQDLYQAIIETLNGGAMLSPSIASKTLKLFRNSEVLEQLSNKEDYNLSVREVEVLEQLSKGIKYEMIAQNLFLSKGTIRKHVENIYTKLQVHNKLEAVHKARTSGLI